MTCQLSRLISPSFYASHQAVKAGTVTELVEKGGRGGGKSSFIAIELVLFLLRHPGCHAAVLRRVAGTLRNSVYPQLLWAIGALGLSGKFNCTVSPMECEYKPTGQKILFFGMDDPGKLKSVKAPFGYIGAVWFEELDQFDSAEQVRSAEQSLFRGGDKTICFKSFNPPASPRHWVNRYALEGRAGKTVHHSDYLAVPPSWLGPRFLADAAHLKQTDPTAYRHEYLGECVGLGRQVFGNLWLRPITEAEIARFDRVTAGVDWGWYPDPFAFNRCHYDSARRLLYIFDELTCRRVGNAETAAMVKARIAPGETVIADSAEEKSVADYRSFGLPCRGAEKGPGSVRYSMKWLQSRTAIVIDPARCPDTAREFSEYEYDRDRLTGETQGDYPDRDNHHIDAVRYATSRIWKRRGS